MTDTEQVKLCGRQKTHPSHKWIINREMWRCPGTVERPAPVHSATRPTWDETWMGVARQVAQRSLCSRDRVGAVVVSATNRIIDTGYNGPPAGFNPLGGRGDDELLSLGCTAWCPRAATRAKTSGDITVSADYSDCPSIHAEANALLFSDRTQRVGGTIYVSSGTCSGCAKLVANSGLVRAVYAVSARGVDTAHRASDRWYDFMRDCGLRVDVINV